MHVSARVCRVLPCASAPWWAWAAVLSHGTHVIFLKNNYIYPVTQSDTPIPTPENAKSAETSGRTPNTTHKKVFRKMPCVPCDMTQDHEGQGLQTNGSDVRAVQYVPGRCATRPTDERQGCAQRVPPERAVKNTAARSFWHIGCNTPMTNISTKPHRYRQMGAEQEHPGIFGAAP